MKIQYQWSWEKEPTIKELSPELSKLYLDLINFNENQTKQEKNRPLHDKLIELHKLDWELDFKKRERASLLRKLNEGK